MANDTGLYYTFIGVTWMLTGVSIIVLCARFYVRTCLVHALGWDDWVMVPAVLLSIASEVLLTIAHTYGLGKKDAALTYHQIVEILKYSYISSTPGILVSIVARISIVIFLWRLFTRVKWLKWFLAVTCILQSSLGIVCIVVVWVQCRPAAAIWNPEIPATRWNPKIAQDIEYATQALFTFSDLTYVALPIAIIWDLRMPLRQKIGLMLLLSLGLFTMAASIMKTIYSESTSGSEGATYSAARSILWSVVEENLVIIMGCIPTLHPMMKLKVFSSELYLPYVTSVKSYFTTSRNSSRGKKSSEASLEAESQHNLNYVPPTVETGEVNTNPNDSNILRSFAYDVSHSPSSQMSTSQVA